MTTPASTQQMTIGLRAPKDLTAVFQPDVNLQERAESLSDQHELVAKNLDIRCGWKKKGGKSGGALNMGGVKIFSGPDKILAGCTGYVWLAADHCAELRDGEIEAHLLHQLMHIGQEETQKGEVRVFVKPHDFAGFFSELEISGIYRADFATAKAHFEQAKIPDFA